MLQQLHKNLHTIPSLRIIETLNQTMQDIRKVLLSLEQAVPNDFWHNTKVKAYQLDFLLKMQSDQISTALATSDYSSLISIADGRQWWSASFGDKTCFVPWSQFFSKLPSATEEDIQHDEKAVKTFLDFCKDDMVSPFEFDVFLRWFGPLKGCCGRMLDALRSGLLAGFVPAIEANVLLENKPIGSFLIRFSKTKPGSFAVTFVDHTKQIKHVLLYNAEPSGVTLKTPPTVFPTLNAFTASHSGKLKWPVGTKAINELAAEASSSREIRGQLSSDAAAPQPQHPSPAPQQQHPLIDFDTEPRQPQLHESQNQSHPDSGHPQRARQDLQPSAPSDHDEARRRYEEQEFSTRPITQARPTAVAVAPQPSLSPQPNPAVASHSPSASPALSPLAKAAETCVICLDAPRETVFLECGHMCCCRTCAKLVQDCPICRQKIVRVIPVFKA